MPEEIRLTLPPDDDMAPVASIAVRAVARQVALPETEIDRLREAVVAAFTARRAGTDEPIELVLHPARGRVSVEIDGTEVEPRT